MTVCSQALPWACLSKSPAHLFVRPSRHAQAPAASQSFSTRVETPQWADAAVHHLGMESVPGTVQLHLASAAARTACRRRAGRSGSLPRRGTIAGCVASVGRPGNASSRARGRSFCALSNGSQPGSSCSIQEHGSYDSSPKWLPVAKPARVMSVAWAASAAGTLSAKAAASALASSCRRLRSSPWSNASGLRRLDWSGPRSARRQPGPRSSSALARRR